MNRLEVFFDYACPYCWRGHEYLMELMPLPQIEIVWRPCEAHPRPERYGPHSDLCIQGMFYADDLGADLFAYHDLMYRGTLMDRIDIEDIDTLSRYVRGLIDPDNFRGTIQSGRYAEALKNANKYAYENSGVWAVPAYRMNGRKLDAVENIGVTKKQLADFIASCYIGM